MTDYSGMIQGSRIRGALYRDPAIFEEELEKIWYRTWVYLGHESEVPARGSYVRRQIGRQQLLMVRSSDDVVRVFYNRCRHRGVLLCHQKSGKTPKFVCPYHAWTFNNDGTLAAPTFPVGMGEDFDKGNLPLIEVARVDSYRGMIFASLAAEGPTLLEHLDGATQFIDLIYDLSPEGEISLDAGAQKVRYDGNWKLLPENTMEGDHHGGIIHRMAFKVFSERSGFNIAATTEGGDLEVIRSFKGGHMVEDYRSVKLGPPPPDWRPTEAQQAYGAALAGAHGPQKARDLMTSLPPLFFVFPNLLYVTTHFRRIEPISASETQVHYTPVKLKGVPDEINQRRLREQEFGAGSAGFITPDDLEIMERNQVGFSADAGDDWLFINRGAFRERQYEDGSTGGFSMDENHLRGFWRHYAEVMGAA